MTQGWDIRAWVVLLCGVSLLCAAALVLMIVALRGRRRAGGGLDHPHCRTCDFDLFGLGEASARCPECGADLGAPKARVWGERRRRPGLTALAVVMLLIGAAGGVAATRATYRHLAVPANQPVWWLMRDLRAGAAGTRYAANAELDRRRGAKELTPRQLHDLAMLPPTKNVAVTSPIAPFARSQWVPSVCVDAAADLRRAGQLSDNDWATVCRRIIGFNLTTRPRVRHGDPVAFALNAGCDGVARTGMTSASCDVVAAQVDDQPVEVSEIRWMQRHTGYAVQGGGEDRGAATLTTAQWPRVPVGKHRLTLAVDAGVRIWNDAASNEAAWRGPIVLTADFEVVPPDAEVVARVAPGALREAVRRCVTPYVDPARTGSLMGIGANGTGDGGNPERAPLDLAFDVILRDAGGREFHAGSFATRKGGVTWWRLDRLPDGCDAVAAAAGVDVLLRPSPREAAKFVDVTAIWGEELRFPGVALRSPGMPPASPAPAPAPAPLPP